VSGLVTHTAASDSTEATRSVSSSTTAPAVVRRSAPARPLPAPAKRLGFTYEGRLRDHVFTNRVWRDSLLHSILDHEWLDHEWLDHQRF
jgi:hypothetical protein